MTQSFKSLGSGKAPLFAAAQLKFTLATTRSGVCCFSSKEKASEVPALATDGVVPMALRERSGYFAGFKSNLDKG